MTFFFYGGIERIGESSAVHATLLGLAAESGLSLVMRDRIGTCSAEQLLRVDRGFDLYELIAPPDLEPYDLFYGNFEDEGMTAHYRRIARDLGVIDADQLEFRSREEVDAAYARSCGDLPGLRFIRAALRRLGDHAQIFCLDHDFDNRFGCTDVCGSEEELLAAAWGTIAFGYTWPNLRLRHEPKEKQS